jgi:cholesterol transport system auxiliary component
VKRAAAIACLALAGCSGGRIDSDAPRVFDLGVDAPAARIAGAHVGAVRAAAPFDSTDMYYRLQFRNPMELLAFTQNRWAAPPAELLRKRMARAADGAAKCMLDSELQEMTQVFGAKDASEALIELRAALSTGNGRVAERVFRVSEPGAGGSAPEAVPAFARASDRAIAELAAWTAAQPACR